MPLLRRKVQQLKLIMKIKIFGIFLTFFSCTVFAQEAYKCTVNGSTVYLDRPCPGSVRRSASMPPSPSFSSQADTPSTASSAQPVQAASAPSAASKTEKDKEYINQRVKERIFERERDLAAAQIANCDADVFSINQRINQIAASSPQGSPRSFVDAQALQLDQQRRQTDIAALQAQASAKQNECSLLRSNFDRNFLKK